MFVCDSPIEVVIAVAAVVSEVSGEEISVSEKLCLDD